MSDHPIKITVENGLYAMRCKKDLRLVEELKLAIHFSKRKWDGATYAWLIDPSAINSLLLAIARAGYEKPDVPPMESAALTAPTVKSFRVEYIGQCKQREGETISALGTTNAENPWQDRYGAIRYDWPIEFPESVLKDWFERAPKAPTNGQTDYQTLCVFETATAQEIKAAYRRLARQWHPDVCREPEATEMFKAINEAYERLADPLARKRYDAGLFFEREAAKPPEPSTDFGHFFMACSRPGRRSKYQRIEHVYFRSPLRCGLIMAEGIQTLSRFTVRKIQTWDDITDPASGRVMTSSWNKITESIEVRWL